MQEFVRVRVAIDSLIEGAKLSIQNKSISESMGQLDQARGLIQELRQRSTIEQAAIVAKRESTIAGLAIIAGKIKPIPVKKRSMKEAVVQPTAL